MFYVYVIKSVKDGSAYIGYTADLRQRLQKHNSGTEFATKKHIPYRLVYYEAYSSKTDAKYREYNLKRFARAYGQLKRRIKNSLE